MKGKDPQAAGEEIGQAGFARLDRFGDGTEILADRLKQAGHRKMLAQALSCHGTARMIVGLAETAGNWPQDASLKPQKSTKNIWDRPEGPCQAWLHSASRKY